MVMGHGYVDDTQTHRSHVWLSYNYYNKLRNPIYTGKSGLKPVFASQLVSTG